MGRTVTEDNYSRVEIKRKINLLKQAFQKINNVFIIKHLSIEVRKAFSGVLSCSDVIAGLSIEKTKMLLRLSKCG